MLVCARSLAKEKRREKQGKDWSCCSHHLMKLFNGQVKGMNEGRQNGMFTHGDCHKMKRDIANRDVDRVQNTECRQNKFVPKVEPPRVI